GDARADVLRAARPPQVPGLVPAGPLEPSPAGTPQACPHARTSAVEVDAQRLLRLGGQPHESLPRRVPRIHRVLGDARQDARAHEPAGAPGTRDCRPEPNARPPAGSDDPRPRVRPRLTPRRRGSPRRPRRPTAEGAAAGTAAAYR